MLRTSIALLLFPAFALGADPCVSGVPVGQRPGPYSFLVATGPQRGQQTCYICEQDDKPAAVIFARSLSAPLAKLVSKLDAELPKRKDAGFKVWVTQLAAKGDLDALAKWSKASGIKNAPVGAFEDVDGPPAYKLASDADVTVLLFVKKKVVANFAFRADELTDEAIGGVVTDLPKLFAK